MRLNSLYSIAFGLVLNTAGVTSSLFIAPEGPSARVDGNFLELIFGKCPTRIPTDWLKTNLGFTIDDDREDRMDFVSWALDDENLPAFVRGYAKCLHPASSDVSERTTLFTVPCRMSGDGGTSLHKFRLDSNRRQPTDSDHEDICGHIAELVRKLNKTATRSVLVNRKREALLCLESGPHGVVTANGFVKFTTPGDCDILFLDDPRFNELGYTQAALRPDQGSCRFEKSEADPPLNDKPPRTIFCEKQLFRSDHYMVYAVYRSYINTSAPDQVICNELFYRRTQLHSQTKRVRVEGKRHHWLSQHSSLFKAEQTLS